MPIRRRVRTGPLLGDKIANTIKKIGGNKIAKKIQKVTGKDCGCGARRNRLNEWDKKRRK